MAKSFLFLQFESISMPKITIGRDDSDLEKWGGEKGTALLGKHLVGEKKEAHTANPIRMDIARPHVAAIVGKRGSGKSYTLGVLAEEIINAEPGVSENISAIIVDTMGIYWSMKYPNEQDFNLLDKWGLEPESMDIALYIPEGQSKEFERRDIPFDKTFTLNPGELKPGDWAMAFEFDLNSPEGILIERLIKDIKQEKGDRFDLEEVIDKINDYDDFKKKTRKALVNRFISAKDWGIFSKEGMDLDEFTRSESISVIDVSLYGEMAEGWSVRTLIVGLIAKRVLRRRMKAKRVEELEEMEGKIRSEMPIVWMLIDEAHQFLPAEGKTPASHSLLQWIKIGREPGVSLALATQKPNKLHEDAISQCDVVLSHRLTSKADIDSLRNIMQTYMRYDLSEYLDGLPRKKGAAICLDDNSERVYSLRVRPRVSWHAGGTPSAIKD